MDMSRDGAVEWVQDVGGGRELGYGLSQKVYGHRYLWVLVFWIQAYRSCISHRHLQHLSVNTLLFLPKPGSFSIYTGRERNKSCSITKDSTDTPARRH